MNQTHAALAPSTEIVYLPVDRIAPNPYQPRRVFPKESLLELAASIREYGVMQPITVRIINGLYYELVAGERRLRASRLAGLSDIPAVIVHIADKDSAILALIENIQRENLNFFDEAEGLKNLIEDYGFTQDEIARKIGKNQSTVANKIRILRLPAEVRKRLLDNELTERHARALLRLPQNDIKLIDDVLSKIITNGLSVKATENLVDGILKVEEPRQAKNEKPQSRQKIKTYFKDLRILKNTIVQAVDIMNGSGLDTVYDFEETSDGCFISIVVSYT